MEDEDESASKAAESTVQAEEPPSKKRAAAPVEDIGASAVTTAPVAPAAAPAPTPEETAPAAEPTPAPEASASEPAAASTAAAAGAASAPAGLKKDKAEKEGTAPRRPVTRAQWWYYIAADEKKYGPYWPGQMRDWFTQKYFSADLLVAPSFSGEIPRKDGFVSIASTFPKDLAETAFVAASGIALYPPAPQQTRIFDVEEEEQEPTSRQWEPEWLATKLEDKRAGKTGFVGGGPVMKGSFVN